jgi:short-subunit dehydrogenase
LGTILVTKAFLPYFRTRKSGTIITTTSSTAYIPYPFIAVYEATKSALETWTAGMSYELNRFNVNIKTVVPGYMKTNFGQNGEFTPHQNYEEDFNRYVSKLMAESTSLADNPEDIAVVVYEAATDNKKQLHYIAGSHATSEYEWLQKDGIEIVKNTIKKRFFE